MSSIHEVISGIEERAEALGVAPSTVGEKLGQGGRFYARLKAGKQAWAGTLETAARGLDLMRQLGTLNLPDNWRDTSHGQTLAQHQAPVKGSRQSQGGSV